MGWMRRQPLLIARDITGESNVSSGNLYLYRSGNAVQIAFMHTMIADTSASEVATLPQGFRPPRTYTFVGSLDLKQSNLSARLVISMSGEVAVKGHSLPADRLYGVFTWFTNEPLPSVLPGVKVA